VYLLTRLIDPDEVNVLFLLQDDGLERIRKYDPAGIAWGDFHYVRRRRPRFIGISYADDADMQKILKLVESGKRDEAFAYAMRGFEVREGDHDMGPTSLLRKPDA